MNFKSVISFGFLISWCFSATSQNTWGSPALDIAIDARSAGLGCKLAADLEHDGFASSYNPTCIDSTNTGIVYLTYLNYLASTNLGAVNAVVKSNSKYTIHTGARFVSYGEFEGYDASGWPTNNFSGGDYYIQSGVAYKIDTGLTVGATVWGGFRNLALENAGAIGADISIMKRWEEKYMAAGILISGVGRQFASTGSQPNGWTPYNFQIGFTKGFNHAPFQFYVNLQNLQDWDLAPDGTYDDGIDPLTGEIVPNDKWKFGDQFARHLNVGVELSFGTNFIAQIGYDHRRRAEMVANGMQGSNGLSLGMGLKLKDLNFRLARNTYHFAGSSTHLSIGINLPG
tara:strand:- start:3741 stop:4766 length:1026 start_codon:yes stop_codon:yes gene_type:complete